MKKIFGIFILALISCSSSKIKIDDNREFYKKNKVQKVTETKIEYEDNLTITSNHVSRITYIDKNGLETKSLDPKYNTFINEENGQYIAKEEKIFDDITTYEYNSNNVLIKKIIKSSNKVEEYTYDNFGNEIKDCEIRNQNDNCCFYKTYEYDSDNKIISVIFSADPCSDLSNTYADNIKKYYKYDSNNNVVSDYRYKYDYKYDGDKIIEKTETDLVNNTNKNVYSYNDKGQITNSKYYYDSNLSCEVYAMYNDNGLCIESKVILNGKIKYVFKYEYEYY